MDKFKRSVLNLKTQMLWKTAKYIVDYYAPNVLGKVVRCSVVHSKSNSKLSFKEKILHDSDVISTSEIGTPISRINIQQLKLDKLLNLYVVLFFSDEILILWYDVSELIKLSALYKFQHKDNPNEAQFMLSQLSLQDEIDNHLIKAISYDDLENLIEGEVI